MLYVRSDEVSRAEFEALGMPPFRPFEEHGPVMSYYQLPEEVLEEPDTLRRWAERAIEIARQHGQVLTNYANCPSFTNDS